MKTLQEKVAEAILQTPMPDGDPFIVWLSECRQVEDGTQSPYDTKKLCDMIVEIIAKAAIDTVREALVSAADANGERAVILAAFYAPKGV